jgi:hypothetical protein
VCSVREGKNVKLHTTWCLGVKVRSMIWIARCLTDCWTTQSQYL